MKSNCSIGYLLCGILLVCVTLVSAQSQDSLFVENSVTLHTSIGDIQGTLCSPGAGKHFPVALIIAGSGPTDRDGNNPLMRNDSYKMLAHELAKKGIASLRYDKRGIGESKAALKDEASLSFEDYVEDAKQWVRLLKADDRFSTVTVIGHSEGSLIGMLAAGNADGYISIAGAGIPANQLLKQQLGKLPEPVKAFAFPALDSLSQGKQVKNVPAQFNALFRPSVQPYLISWFKYDPAKEIKKLSIPILILQGTNDLQVSVEDAKKLSAAAPAAKLVLLKNMNHVLRTVEGDTQANLKTYSDPSLPIDSELVSAIASFLNK